MIFKVESDIDNNQVTDSQDANASSSSSSSGVPKRLPSSSGATMEQLGVNKKDQDEAKKETAAAKEWLTLSMAGGATGIPPIGWELPRNRTVLQEDQYPEMTGATSGSGGSGSWL